MKVKKVKLSCCRVELFFLQNWIFVQVEQARWGWHMDEWAALDREATEWDAMERGGADIEVWVQYLQEAVLCIQFSGTGYIPYRRQTKDFF